MSFEGQKKASLLLRVFAKVLDFIIIAVMAEVVPRSGFYAGLFYMLISDSLFEGRSLGKYLMGIRTVSLNNGTPCSVKDSIIRNSTFGVGILLSRIPLIGWIFLIIIAAFEFLVLLGSKEGMRLGDEIAKTVVIESSIKKIPMDQDDSMKASDESKSV